MRTTVGRYMKQRGKKYIWTRREVGNILQERGIGMSANEIAEALTSRPRRVVQANPIKVAQLLRGAKGVSAVKEARDCDSSKQSVKIYEMSDYEAYKAWINGGRKKI